MNFFQQKASREDEVFIGDQRVKIPKLTPAKWRDLFAAIENLPNLILNVLASPAEDRKAYILVAVDESLEEICKVVALMADLDEQYVYDNAGLDEIVEFIAKTAKRNRLGDMAKNAKSLLGKQTE
jgi:hypothetical protein